MGLITGVDQVLAAARQRLPLKRTASRTVVASTWYSVFDLAGNPGAGVLAGKNTANGVVPTGATAGYPTINAFGGGEQGYLSRVDFGSSVACRIAIFDRVFLAGAYAFNANTALTAQPSFASRVPGGDYTDIQLWVEQVTVATGNQAVNVTYTNESGVGSRTTGATGVGAAPGVGRCWRLPLQSGDRGVQRIDNVAGSVATVGTFNVMLLRQLHTCRVRVANDGDIHDFTKTMFPEVFADSALYMLISADSTASGVPEVGLEIRQV